MVICERMDFHWFGCLLATSTSDFVELCSLIYIISTARVATIIKESCVCIAGSQQIH